MAIKQKQNNWFDTLSSRFKYFKKYTLFSLASLLVVALSIQSFLLYTNNKDNKTAQAASSGNISFDKKYVVNGIEYDTLDGGNSVAQGSNITVRLRYNNTGNLSLNGMRIKDSVPNGFTLVDGTIKACLNPTNTELVCGDNIPAATANTKLFSSTSGMNPIAGLYNTSINEESGIIDIGKKKYINTFIGFNGLGNFSDTYLNANPRWTVVGGYENDQLRLSASSIEGTPVLGFSQMPILGKTYIGSYYLQNSSLQGLSDTELVANNTWPALPPYYPIFLNDQTYYSLVNSYGDIPNSTFSNSKLTTGLLGYRYLKQIQCTDGPGNYSDSYLQSISTNPDTWGVLSAYQNDRFRPISLVNNTTSEVNDAISDLGISGFVCQDMESNQNFIDLLDTTRGSGYIEYKITAPTFTSSTNQKYSTTATLSGGGITTLNEGITGNGTTIGDITVLAIPTNDTVIGNTNLSAGTCTSVVLGNTTTCEFPLGGNTSNSYSLPSGGITVTVPGSTASPSCTITGNNTASAKLTCYTVPTTGSSVGTKAVPTSLGATPTASLVITMTTNGITPGDLSSLSISCSTTSPYTDKRSIIPFSTSVFTAKSICTGTLPPNVTLADNALYLKIGNQNNSSPTTAPGNDNTNNGVCKAGTTNSLGTPFICSSDGTLSGTPNVPTGSATGAQTIWAYLKSTGTEANYNIYLNTLYKTNVYSSKVYANSNLSFILTGSKAPIYGDIKNSGSTDTVGVKLNDLNLYTNLDLGSTSKKYTCFFYAKQLSDTNWRPLKYNGSIVSTNKNEGVLYNTTGNAGCSTNFTRDSVSREYPTVNSDGSANTDGTIVKSDPITAFAWEFRIDVRESANGQTPIITDTLIHSKKGNLNLLFVGALGS